MKFIKKLFEHLTGKVARCIYCNEKKAESSIKSYISTTFGVEPFCEDCYEKLITKGKVERRSQDDEQKNTLNNDKKGFGTWTKQDEEFLEVCYMSMKAEDISEELGRSVRSIYTKAQKLGLKKYNKNNYEEREQN